MDEILPTADHWVMGLPRRVSRGGGGAAIITHRSCSNDCLNHVQTGDIRHHSFPWMRFREWLITV